MVTAVKRNSRHPLPMLELPLCRRVLRAYTRGWRKWALFGAMLLISLLVFLLALYQQAIFDRLEATGMPHGITYGIFVYANPLMLLLLCSTFCCLVLVPVLAAGTLARERERHALELMLLTPLSSARIIGELLLASLTPLSLLLLPYAVLLAMRLTMVRDYMAGHDARYLWVTLVPPICLVAAAFLLAALGLCCASRAKRTVTATATTFTLGALLLVLPLLPALIHLEWYLSSGVPFTLFTVVISAIGIVIAWYASRSLLRITRRSEEQPPSRTVTLAILLACIAASSVLAHLLIRRVPADTLDYLLGNLSSISVWSPLALPAMMMGIAPPQQLLFGAPSLASLGIVLLRLLVPVGMGIALLGAAARQLDRLRGKGAAA